MSPSIKKMRCSHDFECSKGHICVSQRCENAFCNDDSKCNALNRELRCLDTPGWSRKSCQMKCKETRDCGVHQICSKEFGGCITPRCHERAQVVLYFWGIPM